MKHVAIAATKEHRGNTRIWLEGSKLLSTGFAPGTPYQIEYDAEAQTITITAAEAGSRAVTAASRAGKPRPIVDLCNSDVTEVFGQFEAVQVTFYEGKIVLSAASEEQRRVARERRLKTKIASGTPLTTASLFTGVGVLAMAISMGLSDAGYASELAYACDLEPAYLEQAVAKNPAFKPDTRLIEAPMQRVAFDPAVMVSLPPVDILEAGVSCTAHSISGISKKGLSIPESDAQVGHLVAGLLAWIAAANPSIVIVENVPNYVGSASYYILTNQLREWGYNVHVELVKGAEFNALEDRTRMALVGVSKGIEFDFSGLQRPTREVQQLGSVMDDVPADSPMWSRYDYLVEKEKRDKEAGKGFAMQLVDASSTKVGTIGRGYAKVRSTEAKIRHPHDPALMRLLTPAEHARVKGNPEALIEGMSVTKAHEVMGQSVIFGAYRAVAKLLGDCITRTFAA